MHALRLLHKMMAQACPQIHAIRLTALMASVEALLVGRQMSLAGLGRAMVTGARVKHNIKRVDRLIGNRHLWGERTELYGAIAGLVLGQGPRPVIILDWSDLREDRSWQLLRAAVPVGGRSLTLYEEVHPLSAYDNRGVRKRFLDRLREILPPGCRPLLVTDAGFRTTWFRQVEAMGWDWVGRVRGRTHFQLDNEENWQPCRTLHAMANSRVRHIGTVELTESNPLACDLYLVKKKKRGRQQLTCRGTRARGGRSLSCERRQREPWILVTSLGSRAAQQVLRCYQLRMQIEESFRDMKNARLGLHFRSARSNSAERLSILVLIGTLATLVAWLVGQAMQRFGLQRHYQANTTRHRPVLSTVFLGLQSFRRQPVKLMLADIKQSIIALHQITASPLSYA